MKKNTIRYSYFGTLLKLLLFWIVFFPLQRILFMIIHSSLVAESGASLLEIFTISYHAFALDLSTACYLLLLPAIILSLFLVWPKKGLRYLFNTFNILLIVAMVMLSIGEVGLYAEWRVKVNAKALEYLTRPLEVLESNRVWDSIWQIVLMAALCFLFIWVYNRFIAASLRGSKKPVKRLLLLPAFLFSVAFLFFFGRGGLNEIPISQSNSYYSNKEIVNDIAVNSAWNLLHSVSQLNIVNDTNPFISMPFEKADSIVAELHSFSKDTTIRITNVKRPNILIILMESWVTDLSAAYGNTNIAMPQFDKACASGLLFSNAYSNGNRSQQGLGSILGGFPALPVTTLTTVPEKSRNTKTFTNLLNKHDYFTAFYYGGDLRYGNIKAYLLHNQFDEIIEKGEWGNYPQGRLGIHDEIMFDLTLQKLEQIPQPFFVTYFTLSSHSPYDQPMEEKVIDWGDSEDKFHNSVYYTDEQLGKFLATAKTKSWYDSTLIFIIADHPHQSYQHKFVYTAEYRKIPYLLTGGALLPEFRGEKMDKFTSQVDLPATILHQLEINSDDFRWSRNIFNPYLNHEFVFYDVNPGFGWIRPYGATSVNTSSKHIFENTFETKPIRNRELEKGAAYVQVLFQEFVEL